MAVIDIYNTDKKYSVIYADPPWKYNDRMVMKGVHGNIRGAESFYPTMSLKDIEQLPVKEITSENSILFMWITMPFLPFIEEVMKAWGFKYKTCGFTWVKKTRGGGKTILEWGITQGEMPNCA